MSSTPPWRPVRGVVCRMAASGRCLGASGDVAGLPTCEGPTRRRRILVRGQVNRPDDGDRARHKLHSALEHSVAGRIGGR